MIKVIYGIIRHKKKAYNVGDKIKGMKEDEEQRLIDLEVAESVNEGA